MPQLNQLVLKDKDNVDHTFSPTGITGGVATLEESTGIPIGNKRLTLSSSQTAAGRRKVTLKFAIPIVQDASVNGVSRPTVVRTGYADLTFSFDGGSSTAERHMVRHFLAQSLSNAMIESMVNDLQSVY